MRPRRGRFSVAIQEKPTDGRDRRIADSQVVQVHTFVRHQGGQWHATAADYTIVGSGETPRLAIDQMLELLADYFAMCAAEGLSLEESRRPIGRRWQLQLQALVALSRLRRQAAAVRELRVPSSGAGVDSELDGLVGC